MKPLSTWSSARRAPEAAPRSESSTTKLQLPTTDIQALDSGFPGHIYSSDQPSCLREGQGIYVALPDRHKMRDIEFHAVRARPRSRKAEHPFGARRILGDPGCISRCTKGDEGSSMGGMTHLTTSMSPFGRFSGLGGFGGAPNCRALVLRGEGRSSGQLQWMHSFAMEVESTSITFPPSSTSSQRRIETFHTHRLVRQHG